MPLANGPTSSIRGRLVAASAVLATVFGLGTVGYYLLGWYNLGKGTWSLGDYPGSQSLRWGYQLLRDGFGFCQRISESSA